MLIPLVHRNEYNLIVSSSCDLRHASNQIKSNRSHFDALSFARRILAHRMDGWMDGWKGLRVVLGRVKVKSIAQASCDTGSRVVATGIVGSKIVHRCLLLMLMSMLIMIRRPKYRCVGSED